MNNDFVTTMQRAAQSLRAQNVLESTRLIQNALIRRPVGDSRKSASSSLNPEPKPELRLIGRQGANAEVAVKPSARQTEGGAGAGVTDTKARLPQRARIPLDDVLRTLRDDRPIFEPFGPGVRPSGKKRRSPPALPDGARFFGRSFSCAAGTRNYKLYVPASANERPNGLIVMLHGCGQDPDDFALGTNMNAVAESRGLMVAYPDQTSSANKSSCWNWFNPADQARGKGEPSIIAGMTRAVASEFGIDRRRVFVAGLSAGGAMAVVMGETYPDLFAAVGIHSGLAYRSAHDVVSAFAAMRGDFGRLSPARAAGARNDSRIRTIIFHGSADRTVASSNADRLVANAKQQFPRADTREVSRRANGRNFTQTTVQGEDGLPVVELWLIQGAGHAWSGGCDGSFTDPRGPSASDEMMRFFLTSPSSG